MDQMHHTIHWTAQTGGAITAELASVGQCDLSIMRIGVDRVSWLVRHGGRDVAEGVERTPADAKASAERHATWAG